MEALEESVQALIRAAEGAPEEYDTTREHAGRFVQEAHQANRARRDAALRLLAPTVANAEVPHVGIIALACGALVEDGADPLVVLQPVLKRLEETFEPATLFVDGLRAAARSAGDEDEDLATQIERYTAQVGPRMPESANAFGSLDLLWRPACSLLVHGEQKMVGS
jgi:hypothetical protein